MYDILEIYVHTPDIGIGLSILLEFFFFPGYIKIFCDLYDYNNVFLWENLL